MKEIIKSMKEIIDTFLDDEGNLVFPDRDEYTEIRPDYREGWGPISRDNIVSLYIGKNNKLGGYRYIDYENDGYRDDWNGQYSYDMDPVIYNCPNLEEATISIDSNIDFPHLLVNLIKHSKGCKLILKYDEISVEKIEKLLLGLILDKKEKNVRAIPKKYYCDNDYEISSDLDQFEIVLNGPEVGKIEKWKILNIFKMYGFTNVKFVHEVLVPHHIQIHSDDPVIEHSLKTISLFLVDLPYDIRKDIIKKIKEMLEEYKQARDGDVPSVSELLSGNNTSVLTLNPKIGLKKNVIADIIEMENSFLNLSQYLKDAKLLKKIVDCLFNGDKCSFSYSITVKVEKIKKLIDSIDDEETKNIVINYIKDMFEVELDKIYFNVKEIIINRDKDKKIDVDVDGMLNTSIDNLDVIIKYNNIMSAIGSDNIERYSNDDDIVSSIKNVKYIISNIQNNDAKDNLLDMFNNELNGNIVMKIKNLIANNDYSIETYKNVEIEIRLILQKILLNSRNVPIKIDIDDKDILVDSNEYEKKINRKVYMSFVEDIKKLLDYGVFTDDDKKVLLSGIDERIKELDNGNLVDLKELVKFLADIYAKLELFVGEKNNKSK